MISSKSRVQLLNFLPSHARKRVPPTPRANNNNDPSIYSLDAKRKLQQQLVLCQQIVHMQQLDLLSSGQTAGRGSCQLRQRASGNSGILVFIYYAPTDRRELREQLTIPLTEFRRRAVVTGAIAIAASSAEENEKDIDDEDLLLCIHQLLL